MQPQSLALLASPAPVSSPVATLSLLSGDEWCALRPGVQSLGGRGFDAVSLGTLAREPRSATITLLGNGRAMLQRTTASVVVRLDGEPIGISAVELRDYSEIEFGEARLVFKMGPAWDHQTEAEIQATAERPVGVMPMGIVRSQSRPMATGGQPAAGVIGAALVNVSTGARFVLTEHRIVIGRDEGCDIVVKGNGVSRRHASITAVAGGFMLRDESSNGTLVNGNRVAGTYLLGHGDVVRFHNDELRLELDSAPTPEHQPAADATAILDLSHITKGLGGAEPRPPAPKTLSASLEIVRGSFAGACFQIERAVCSIGRGEENDVRIRDDTVSTTHATLLRKGDAWYVVDLRSMNGTFVEGSRVAGERELHPGARLRVGAVELVFRAFDTAVEIPAPPRRDGLVAKLRKAWRTVAPPTTTA